MPGKIRILGKNVSDKIAAGEVVENPASVVKELVENSIDAGATSITVEIEGGGKVLIKVTDNGEGIERDDVRRAFLRHATSKIRDIWDLDRIYSLGFRGEALASIAAVSMVMLVTRTGDSIEGTIYKIHGGREMDFGEVGCPQGTSIEVRELFFNTPARKEYLKSDGYEASLVNDIVTRLALARADISFKLISNGRLLLNTPGNGNLSDTIISLYGREVGENLIRVSCSSEGIKIDGYVSRPHVTRANRSYQSIFVNGRFVRSRIITQALEDSYRTMLMVNRYPVAVLNLSLDPRKIDVNVHPAKFEVRFKEEERIKGIVYDCIRANLEKGRWIAPVAKFGSPEQKQDKRTQGAFKQIKEYREIRLQELGESKSGRDDSLDNYSGDLSMQKTGQKQQNDRFKEESIEYNRIEMDNIIESNNNKIPDMRIVGQFLSTFILAEGEKCVYLIDQHAAHERIVYEEMTERVERGQLSSQRLLEPIIIEMSPLEIELINENMDIIEKIGFELEEFGLNSIAVRSVPTIFGVPQTREFLNDLVKEFSEGNRKRNYRLKQEEIIGMACKKAVKANQRLSFEEMESLIEQLRNTKIPFTCPHGRPVIITLTKYDLEKMFKRVQ